jgi:hypothetical protein
MIAGAMARIATGATGAVRNVRSLVARARISRLDRDEVRRREAVAFAGPTVGERQADLLVFYERYEELVELLCDAAQYGPTAKLEADYARLQSWMRDHYPPVRRFVVAYLRYSPDDTMQSLHFQGRSADAFEALVAAPNLDEFLRVDDGGMISRIHRTREALNLYGEHLRQLAVSQANED